MGDSFPTGRAVVVFYLLALITLTFIFPVYASTYAYMPTIILLNPIAPPVWFDDPRENQVTVVLGPNSTSALSAIKALTSNIELTFNSDFYNGPDGWYFIPGTYLTSAYWVPSYQGAIGVIEIYGTIPAFTSDAAGIFQNVTIPSTSLSMLTEEITYYYPSVPLSLCYIIGGLYDWDLRTWVYRSSVSCQANTWSTATFNIDSSAVTPGKTYALVAAVYLANYLPLARTYYIYYDNVSLVAMTANPAYSGNWLLSSSDSGSYWSKLIVKNALFNGEVNATIWLTSIGGAISTPIKIENSKVVTEETSEIQFTEPPSGYSSLYFKIETSIEAGSSCTIELRFVFRTSGVLAEYPVTLSISDPSETLNSSSHLEYSIVIPVYKVLNGSISLELGEELFEK